MKCIGLDLSTVSTGWSVFIDDKLTRSGKTMPPQVETMIRIKLIVDDLKWLIDCEKPDKVVIEDVFYGSNYLTTKMLNRLAGAVVYMLLSWRKDLQVIFVTPTQARKCLGMLPKATKRHVVDAVNVKFGRELKLSDNDEADAIVLGYYGWYEEHEPDESFKKTDQQFFKTNLKSGIKTKPLRKKK